MKRLPLTTGQEVLIIFDTTLGYVQQPARFVEYRMVPIGNAQRETPVFQYDDQEILGLNCFWLRKEDARTQQQIEKAQKELIDVQIRVSELSEHRNLEIPRKLKDREIQNMAQANLERRKAIIKKLGFDPYDESWIEKEMASSQLEKDWFEFERLNALAFVEKPALIWNDIASMFNHKHQQNITGEMAKNLSKKRMRYLLGAYTTRMKGNNNTHDWRTAAQEFEQQEREREGRMITWSLAHKGKFPIARAKKPIQFSYGPYFNQCIEQIPHVFTSPACNMLKTGTMLRVISYDPNEHFILLDFLPDVRTKIKGPHDPNAESPWRKDDRDYEIPVTPEQIDEHLEFLEKLT